MTNIQDSREDYTEKQRNDISNKEGIKNTETDNIASIKKDIILTLIKKDIIENKENGETVHVKENKKITDLAFLEMYKKIFAELREIDDSDLNEIVKSIESSKDLNSKNSSGENIITLLAILHTDESEKIKKIKNKLIKYISKFKKTKLLNKIKPLILELSKLGVDINNYNSECLLSALGYAAVLGDKDMVEFLIQNGADVNMTDNNGLSIYENSITEEISKIIASSPGFKIPKAPKLRFKQRYFNQIVANLEYLSKTEKNEFLNLIKASNNINIANEYGDNMLKADIEILIEKRITVNDSKNIITKTLLLKPFMKLIISSQKKCIAEYIQMGVDVNFRNLKDGKDALIIASIHEDIDMVEFLIKNGADVNNMTNGMPSALMHSAISGNIKLSQLLIKNGADINYLNFMFDSIYKLATPEIKIILKSHPNFDSSRPWLLGE